MSSIILCFLLFLYNSCLLVELEGELPDSEARQMMYDLTTMTLEEVSSTVDLILKAEDSRFISVFTELLLVSQVGIVLDASEHYIRALETLSGKNFGGNWAQWVEWYGNTDIQPPPGFKGWKGTLLGNFDPQFEEFLNDNAATTIRVEEIQWGGVKVDGIPALDNPKMIPRKDADYLISDEPIFGIAINNDARAYPLRIMDWHEMVNDIIDGIPVTLSYCTLCGAAIAYDGVASNGQSYTFGSSGLLFRSNKLMYDRQTRTLWNQLLGVPVVGELAGSGVELSLVPVVLTTWENWQSQHPDTLVLDIETGFNRPYSPGAAYGHYFSSEDTMFRYHKGVNY